MIHIAVELIVLVAVVWYFQSQVSKLKKSVQELKNSVAHHEDVLKMILVRMGAAPRSGAELPKPPSTHPQQQPAPSQQPHPQQQRHMRPPQPEQPPASDQNEESEEDEEQFNREIDQEVQEIEKKEEDHDVESVDITRTPVGRGVGLIVIPQESKEQEERVTFVKPKDLKSKRRIAK